MNFLSSQDARWNVYSDRALLYARFRLNYAPEVVAEVAKRTELKYNHTVADIGAGTGILTQHFLDRARRVYCIEPNAAMLHEAEVRFRRHSAFISVSGSAEATGLPQNSVHLIVAGMALDWFHPERALREFRRILIPSGWLATFRYRVDESLVQELAMYLKEIPKPAESIRPGTNDPSRYFAPGYFKIEQKCSCNETFDQFIGGASATEGAPSVNSPEYDDFRSAHQRAFLALSVDGKLRLNYTCTATVGRLRQHGYGTM